MNSSEIKMMLTKVVLDLQYIQHSQPFQFVLDTSVTDSEVGAIADSAILFAKKLRLSFEDAVDTLDATELDDEQYLGVEVGYPEGQLLPHCKGNHDLCGELSEIYHLGGEFPDTGDYTLNEICDRLSKNSGYGAYRNWD
ncbi:hypothetical protein G7B40_041080 [Aetokthonos hydrillicola Thurmond2011]|jgi:hypothetical protein|uniref:Uncharacterized protein n=1 Tax=Aetokthonos hydrillicola Thurmond2011 TaxID=2712845 RepID=A0AAP5IFP6_9CYAN|nr:hypothetical protein [Aetokthonos hydrillicola]MBO3463017.1 hypothetical protein [Aetokthonos hydrillicola CCALA 1050]MBW4590834.1 hypothetical protein [Aetokthonos hydrillicola CCALA 1050]MDR9900881.1 hypothetical protein [Aetokthonos hydrillicola Thurmond2011]